MDRKAYPVNASGYKIQEEIGQGVSALVYRALCIPFNEIVAVKCMDLERFTRDLTFNVIMAIKCMDLERFTRDLDDVRREAQTLSLVNHHNVLKAYCSFVVDHALWVVMPYMAGGSCLHIMKVAYPDGFEEPIIATFLKETLKALEYLHHHGHIHRDVKAGNILIDANGAVKLGDFGVSAFMFDNGDRQRSRNTFVGTPCWMAPEVLEQVHGYDFKADIWSFGITALELAHGHAPFSKYPPIKVLLMTLQSAPPGLDYERDKRFSKSFKEMIAMCLVKDPTKRPSAEKLLKHSFFKHAKSADHISRTILGHLPPLWERVSDLKKKDAARLIQKKMPYGEQEQRSQHEYKRGVSSWNFDVEDLKGQAALIQDDEPVPIKEEKEPSKPSEDNTKNSSLHPTVVHENDKSQTRGPVAIHALTAESETDSGECVTRVRSGPLLSPLSSKHLTHSKEHSSSSHNIDDHTQSTQISKQRLSSAPLTSSGTPVDSRIGNSSSGPARSSMVQKDVPEEKLKGALVQKKGRFSVTSDGEESAEGALATSNSRKNPSSHTPVTVSTTATSIAPPNYFGLNASTVLPQLQSLLSHATTQQDIIINLMTNLSTENVNASRATSHASKTVTRNTINGSTDPMVEIPTDRERELIIQVAELQCRQAVLTDELQAVKLKNMQLERKLNAIYNKEEEERIRKEEAAREDG